MRYGDVWFPVASNPRHPLNSIDLFKGGIKKLHEMAEDHGRDPASIGLALFANAFEENKPVKLENGGRHLLTGKADEVAEDINALAQLGVHDLIINFQRDTLEQTLDSIQYFNDVIRPMVS